MKASELRIGNWVNNNGEDYQITSATIVSLERGDSTAQPIPIMHDWLYKLGFENLTHNHEWFDVATYVHKKISFFVHFDGERLSVDFWIGNEKRYVHELQNLFYVLTGEELELMLG